MVSGFQGHHQRQAVSGGRVRFAKRAGSGTTGLPGDQTEVELPYLYNECKNGFTFCFFRDTAKEVAVRKRQQSGDIHDDEGETAIKSFMGAVADSRPCVIQ